MSKLYDRAFKGGFIGTVVFFAVLNVASFIKEHLKYLECVDRMRGWSGNPCFYNWGFPFNWEGYIWEDALFGLVLNFTVIVGCGFAVGFLVRFISRQFGLENR